VNAGKASGWDNHHDRIWVSAMLRNEGGAHQATARTCLRSVWPVAVVCIVGLAVMLPLLLRPYATRADDLFYHLFRSTGFDQQVTQGDAYPLRFPGQGYGYGLAVLSYYPPLAYFLMETAHLLGANYLFAYQAIFIIAALGAALSSYYLGVRVFNRTAALAVGIAYVFNPYFLAEIWKRGAVTETLALAVAPLLFAAILRVTAESSWRAYVEAALAVALVILAHPLSIYLFAPFLALWTFLALVLTEHSRRWRAVLILAASVFTGALLTCFYWLPVQLESAARRTIDVPAALQYFVRGLKPIGQVVRVGLATVFRSGETVPDFSIAMLLLVAISLIHFVLTLRRKDRKGKAQFVFFAVSAALAFLAMTSWTGPLWERLTQFAYLQFPFRWFGPLALFTALVIGGSLSVDVRNRRDWWYRIAVGAILGFLVITSLMNAPTEPVRLPSAGITKLTASDLDEPGLLLAYERNEADVSAIYGCWVWFNRLIPSTSLLSECPRYLDIMLKDAPVRSGLPAVAAQVIPKAAGPNLLEATVNSAVPWNLSLHAFWIPGWTATVDGQPAPTGPTDAIGLAGVALPAGEHVVRLAFGPTLLRRAAMWVSLLALLGWLVIAWRRHWRLATVVTVLLVLVVGAIGGRALAAPKLPSLTSIDVNLGGKIGLEGYAYARQGDAVDVRLLWLARQPMEESYKVFIHVDDDQGKLLAQTDSRPQGYADNTNRWIPGQATYDRFEVPLPSDAPPGRYQVRVGLYSEADGQRLPVLDAAGKAVDNQVLLGYFEVP
jgi:hypothetical protein